MALYGPTEGKLRYPAISSKALIGAYYSKFWRYTMGVLQRLWVAMLTQNTDDAGTNDPIVLIINEDGVDKLHHTFLDTSQDDQDQGQANLYEINVEGRNIRSENLTNSSIRMAIRGSNLWRPQHILV